VRGSARQSAPVEAAADDDHCARAPLILRIAENSGWPAGRYSMAWWMPSSSRPGMAGRAAPWRPPTGTMGEGRERQRFAEDVGAAYDPPAELGAFRPNLVSRRPRGAFQLERWDASRSRPPGGVVELRRRSTACPGLVRGWAAGEPGRPEPITATVGRSANRGGTERPSPTRTRSMISTRPLVVTGSALNTRERRGSHGGGKAAR